MESGTRPAQEGGVTVHAEQNALASGDHDGCVKRKEQSVQKKEEEERRMSGHVQSLSLSLQQEWAVDTIPPQRVHFERRAGFDIPHMHCSELKEVSEEKFGRSQVTVSNVAGFLCHISSEAFFPCSPRNIFAILSNPDNSGVFRDIKALGYRKVIEEGPGGYKVVEVEQQGEVKIMWRTHKFSTVLTVTEDSRDENALTTAFSLIKSDVLSKFQGTWTLYPGPSEEGQESTRAVLEQDVLPKGVPPFITHMPLLGSILRGICVRAVRRLQEDIEGVVEQARQEGVPVEEVLRPKNRQAGAQRWAPEPSALIDRVNWLGTGNNGIQSHAVMQTSDSEEDDE